MCQFLWYIILIMAVIMVVIMAVTMETLVTMVSQDTTEDIMGPIILTHIMSSMFIISMQQNQHVSITCYMMIIIIKDIMFNTDTTKCHQMRRHISQHLSHLIHCTQEHRIQDRNC